MIVCITRPAEMYVLPFLNTLAHLVCAQSIAHLFHSFIVRMWMIAFMCDESK